MMKFKIAIILILCFSKIYAQSVTLSPSGVLVPSMTTTARTALTATNGQLVYDTTTSSFWYYNGSIWKEIGTSSGTNSWTVSGVNQYSTPTGNVGVGTTSPIEKLHIEGGNLLSTGTFGSSSTLSVSGVGTRMFFYPKKAAFRAGYTTGTFNDENIGNYSVAMGYDNLVSSEHGIGLGKMNIVLKNNAFGFGEENIVNGFRANAWGYRNILNDTLNYAIGFNNIISKAQSFAFGGNNVTYGYQNYTAGFSNITYDSLSTAIGYGNISEGNYALSIGRKNVASNDKSIAIGHDNITRGNYSIALGSNLISPSFTEVVIGRTIQFLKLNGRVQTGFLQWPTVLQETLKAMP